MRQLRVVGMLMGLLWSTQALAATFAPPPPATPHLKSYSVWGSLWWQWAFGTPAANNPVLDTTGANCAVNQPVPGVFLLAGTFDGSAVNRTCTVPVGTAFVMPLINVASFAQQTDPPEQRTEAFLRAQAACIESPPPSLSITVDGQALANPLNLLEKSVVFSVNLPPGNVLGVPPQLLSPSVDEGWYAFIEPLTPGAHSLHVVASTTACGGGFNENVTYTLIVQGTVGTPISCSGTQSLTFNGIDIQTNNVAITVSGNCNVTIRNSVLFGGSAGILIHDQGHVIVENSVVGGGPAAGGFAISADGHGHGEFRNSAIISPNSARQFAVISDSGGNTSF